MDLHGKYRMGPRLGGGGMAEVYRAEIAGAEGFSRPVAIKRLHAEISADDTFCDMFIREARLLSQLHHANIVSVLDFEWDESGKLFLVMELVDGVDLSQLAGTGQMPVPVALYVMVAVLRALAHAHERKIVHRDVSPHNVLISWLGEVKLTDFGLAKAIMSSHVSPRGGVKGKVRYLSPDQLQGLTLDGRADLFSAGVMLYELVTGRSPFTGAAMAPSTMAESIARMLTGTIVPPRDLRPEVPVAVESVIMRLLERERDRRFASAQEVLAALPCPPGGTEDLAALLLERFPDMQGMGQESLPSEDVSLPHIRGRRRGEDSRIPRRAMPRWLRYSPLLVVLLAFATILTARPRDDGGAGPARVLGAPAADAGIGVDAAAILAGQEDEPSARAAGSGAAPRDAEGRDVGVSRVRPDRPAPRPQMDRTAGRIEKTSRDRRAASTPAVIPADASVGTHADDIPVDAASAPPVRAPLDAGPAVPETAPPTYGPYTRSNPWGKIEGDK